MDKVLVTGANGHFGRGVLEALPNSGSAKENIHAMARDRAKAAALQSLGVHVVFGDYGDYGSLPKASSGMDRLPFISGSDPRNRALQHRLVAKNAAKNAGGPCTGGSENWTAKGPTWKKSWEGDLRWPMISSSGCTVEGNYPGPLVSIEGRYICLF